MIDLLATEDCLEVMREARNSHCMGKYIMKDKLMCKDLY